MKTLYLSEGLNKYKVTLLWECLKDKNRLLVYVNIYSLGSTCINIYNTYSYNLYDIYTLILIVKLLRSWTSSVLIVSLFISLNQDNNNESKSSKYNVKINNVWIYAICLSGK